MIITKVPKDNNDRPRKPNSITLQIFPSKVLQPTSKSTRNTSSLETNQLKRKPNHLRKFPLMDTPLIKTNTRDTDRMRMKKSPARFTRSPRFPAIAHRAKHTSTITTKSAIGLDCLKTYSLAYLKFYVSTSNLSLLLFICSKNTKKSTLLSLCVFLLLNQSFNQHPRKLIAIRVKDSLLVVGSKLSVEFYFLIQE